MTKREVDSKPGKVEAEHSGPPAVTDETDKAPATASEGKLPVVSAAGPGEWNASLLGSLAQVASGADLHGDDVAEAMPRVRAAIEAMRALSPDDVIADMLTAQLVASHILAMDCYRRAAGGGELEAWREALAQGNRLTRTFTMMVETLNRHSGRTGQQTVRVEHVTVNDGGQAIVGAVASGEKGGGA